MNNSSSNGADKTSPTLAELAEEVKRLRTQIDQETRGFTGWIKWLGTILAFIAAIFAVPKGAIEVWDAVFSRPNTSITPESYLSMPYSAKAKAIVFDGGFTVANNRKKHDSIKNLSAKLESIDPTYPDPLLKLDTLGFTFSEKNAKIPNHFSISKDSPREINYRIEAQLTDQKRESLLRPKSRWRLTIELTGEYGKVYTIKNCFDMSKKIIDDVFGSPGKGTRRFLNPWCEESSQ